MTRSCVLRVSSEYATMLSRDYALYITRSGTTDSFIEYTKKMADSNILIHPQQPRKRTFF